MSKQHACIKNVLTCVFQPAIARHTVIGPNAPTTGVQYAIVQCQSTQYKACVGDVLVAEAMGSDVKVGDHIRLDRVLLAGTAEKTVVGRPIIADATVEGLSGEFSAEFLTVCLFRSLCGVV